MSPILKPRHVSDPAEVCEICEPCPVENLLVLRFYPQPELRCNFNLGNGHKVVSKLLVEFRLVYFLYIAESPRKYTRMIRVC